MTFDTTFNNLIHNLPSFNQHKIFDFKNNSFDFIRLFLACLVVVFHAFGFYYSNNFWHSPFIYFNADVMSRGGRTDWGELAVLGFFVISGFLITRSAIYSKSWASFFAKRFRRIYPGYLGSLFVTCFVFAPLTLVFRNDYSQLSTVINETLGFFFRSLWIETPVTKIPTLTSYYFNGSYWTLLQEVRAYILIVILAYFGWLKSNLKLGLITGLLHLTYFTGLYYPTTRFWVDFVFYDFRFVALFTYFLVGAMFFVNLEKIKWTWLGFTLSCFGILLSFQYNLAGIFLPVCGSYWLLFLSQVLPFKNLSTRIGDLSYGIYVYSSPLQVCLLYTPLVSLGFGIYTLTTLIISIVFGYLSWNYVEKRFLTKVR